MAISNHLTTNTVARLGLRPSMARKVDLTNSGGSVNETVSYMLTDHLGSVDDVHGCTSAARPWEIPEGGRKPEAANVEPIHMTGRVCD